MENKEEKGNIGIRKKMESIEKQREDKKGK